MSLSAPRLAVGIKAALVAIGALDPNPATDQFALDLATAIVTELKDHAEVVVTMPPDGTGTIT